MRAISLHCPSCRAPIAPPAKGNRLTCSFCGALVLLDGTAHAATFRAALEEWKSPASQGFSNAFEVGGSSWITGQRLGGSETSEVFAGQLARRPSGFAIVRVLHAEADVRRAARAWEALARIWTLGQRRDSSAFVARLPIPLATGTATGAHPAQGRRVVITGWRPGFRLTLREAAELHGGRIAPAASVWVWRRVLETLEFMHRFKLAHGAVMPEHLLIEDGEHGVSFVGFGSAGELHRPYQPGPGSSHVRFSSDAMRASGELTAALDLQMSARTMIEALGGDAATATIPREVPEPLAALLREIALASPEALASASAFELRGRVGRVAAEVFGPPSFHPLTLRSGAPFRG